MAEASAASAPVMKMTSAPAHDAPARIPDTAAAIVVKWYFVIALRLAAYSSCFFFGAGVSSYLSGFGVAYWTIVAVYGILLYEIVAFAVYRLYKPGFYLDTDKDAPADGVTMNDRDYEYRLGLTRSMMTFMGYYAVNIFSVFIVAGTPFVDTWVFGMLGLILYAFSFLGSVLFTAAAYDGRAPVEHRVLMYMLGAFFQLPLLVYAGYAIYTTFLI